jgi:hypothetical protein
MSGIGIYPFCSNSGKIAQGGRTDRLVASSGIEPELSALRGRRVNQLHHDATVD